MKPDTLTAILLAVCTCACARSAASGTGQARAASTAVRSVWKADDALVSMLSKKQDANLLRLAQQQAAEKALEEQQAASQRVPPSMYRTTEPPLPEPDLTLPVSDVPRPTPSPAQGQ